MIEVNVDDIDHCIEQALSLRNKEVILNHPTAPYVEIVFLKAFSQLQERYGLPAYPLRKGADKLPKGLKKIFRLMAVWELPERQITIRMEAIEGRKFVFLTCC